MHTHTPARKKYTNFQLYYFVIHICSANCLGHGHGHGYECQSTVTAVPFFLFQGLLLVAAHMHVGARTRRDKRAYRCTETDTPLTDPDADTYSNILSHAVPFSCTALPTRLPHIVNVQLPATSFIAVHHTASYLTHRLTT